MWMSLRGPSSHSFFFVREHLRTDAALSLSLPSLFRRCLLWPEGTGEWPHVLRELSVFSAWECTLTFSHNARCLCLYISRDVFVFFFLSWFDYWKLETLKSAIPCLLSCMLFRWPQVVKSSISACFHSHYSVLATLAWHGTPWHGGVSTATLSQLSVGGVTAWDVFCLACHWIHRLYFLYWPRFCLVFYLTF